MSKPRILVSNDDGFHAPGIQALAEALRALGDVWVVAPDRERSATSHAISLHKPLRIHALSERSFMVDGTPTDCVYVAMHHLMASGGPPDVVVSGINRGPNLGNDVIYSGTVSAAMEGAMYGHNALAVSLAVKDAPDGAGGGHRYDTAARIAADLTRQVLHDRMPPGVVLNVNVPDRDFSDIRGLKLSRLGYTDWADAVSVREDPRGRPYFWIGGDRGGHDSITDSDNNAVGEGYVSVTPIHYDLTDYRSFDYSRKLRVEGLKNGTDELGSDPLPHPTHPRLRREPRRR